MTDTTEKLREIFVFVAFVVGIAVLILAVFQFWSGKFESGKWLLLSFGICGAFLFLSQIKTFKVWEVQVELNQTIDEAKSVIGRLRRLAEIGAKATYMQMAWGNRLGAPPAREKQAVLDGIDNQLAELKASPEQIADIQRPFVKMMRVDFFFLFQGVVMQYAAILNSELTDAVHKAPDASVAAGAAVRHSDLITAWEKRVHNDDPAAELERQPLEDFMNGFIPKSGEWLGDKDLAVIRKFKDEIVRLNAACEKKGGYTPEAVIYYDRYSGDNNGDKAKQIRNEALQ